MDTESKTSKTRTDVVMDKVHEHTHTHSMVRLVDIVSEIRQRRDDDDSGGGGEM